MGPVYLFHYFLVTPSNWRDWDHKLETMNDLLGTMMVACFGLFTGLILAYPM
jgi:hypothetical protein